MLEQRLETSRDGKGEDGVVLGTGDAGDTECAGGAAERDGGGDDASGWFGGRGAFGVGGPGPEQSGGGQEGECDGEGEEDGWDFAAARFIDWPAGQFRNARRGALSARFGHSYVSLARMPSKKIFRIVSR